MKANCAASGSAAGSGVKWPIFILGCERSGSTWIGNIFDAHPDVEFFMEPFAPAAGIFAGFPGRFEQAEGAGIEAIVKHGFGRLFSIKYPLLYRPGRSTSLIALDRRLVKLRRKLARRLGGVESVSAGYNTLNLNRRDMPVARIPGKRPRPERTVVKELRLNWKTGFIGNCFPGARVVVSIRHPGAQIASIISRCRTGSLCELSECLPAFAQALRPGGRFACYASGTDASSPGKAELLSSWWFASYDALFRGLADAGLPHVVLDHFAMSADPEGESRRMLEFCGLEWCDSVSRYLAWSSSGGDADPESAVDTRRDSAAFAREAIHHVPDGVNEALLRVWKPMNERGVLCDRLRDYVSGALEKGAMGKRELSC